MGGRNFEKDAQRRNVARRGYEDVAGGLPIPGQPFRNGSSKAAQRAEIGDLLAAVTEITRLFECRPCQHQFRARQAIAPTEPMACPKCGRIT
jgi:DNA-directed RNA polymerase subunit RPC12/RpoP